MEKVVIQPNCFSFCLKTQKIHTSTMLSCFCTAVFQVCFQITRDQLNQKSVAFWKSNRSDRMLLAYCLALAIVVVSWYHKKYSRRNKLLSKIPTITSYPLIGSNLSFVGKSAPQIFQMIVKTSEQLGSLWRFDLSPFQSNIVIAEPKIAEAVLSSQKLIEKSVEYNFIKQWLNEGENCLINSILNIK